MIARKYVVVGVAADTTITVVRVAASTERAQGLVLDSDRLLTVADVEASRIVLWADTAPATVDVKANEAAEMRIWNVWREGDLIQAWEGEAGMTVDDTGDDLGLVCHDAHPDVAPDLVVRLSFDRAWTQPADDDQSAG